MGGEGRRRERRPLIEERFPADQFDAVTDRRDVRLAADGVTRPQQ